MWRWRPGWNAANSTRRCRRVAAEILAASEAPTIYARAFAPLILAELLSRDARQPTLEPEMLKTLRSAWAHWYLSETDLRSHDPEHGWLHALAHGADAALFFALHPALPPDDRSAWVQALAPRLTPTFGQPRPVAMALTVQVARSLLLFTLLGAQLPGGQVIPAPAREGWPDELLAVLRLAFPAYPE